jgi:PAS domain-containing protein
MALARRIPVPERSAARYPEAMAQREMELILMRQLASCLAVPVVISDANGDLVFFNEPAESLLGRRFDEVDALPVDERQWMFRFRDESGASLPNNQRPLVVALRQRRPMHRRVWARALDGTDQAWEVTAFPLEAAGGRLVGAVAMFWERHPG